MIEVSVLLLNRSKLRDISELRSLSFPFLRELNLDENQLTEFANILYLPSLQIARLNANRIERLVASVSTDFLC